MPRLAKRPQVDHKKAAARLREHPRMWMVVGEYRSSIGADKTASLIRTAFQRHNAYPSPWAPAGAFEARTELTEDGTNVIARYVGGAS